MYFLNIENVLAEGPNFAEGPNLGVRQQNEYKLLIINIIYELQDEEHPGFPPPTNVGHPDGLRLSPPDELGLLGRSPSLCRSTTACAPAPSWPRRAMKHSACAFTKYMTAPARSDP